MGRSNIPDRWLNYQPIGKQVEDTRFIAFKVPLGKHISDRVEGHQRLDIELLLERVPNLGLVIDLTDTFRYYNPKAFLDMGVDYRKLRIPGHRTPPPRLAAEFREYVRNFLEDNKNDEKLIGVHCTHGVNRTGYLICNYMISNMAMEPDEAINKFVMARGHNIERGNYLDDLRKRKADQGEEEKKAEINSQENLIRDYPRDRQNNVGEVENWRRKRRANEEDHQNWRQRNDGDDVPTTFDNRSRDYVSFESRSRTSHINGFEDRLGSWRCRNPANWTYLNNQAEDFSRSCTKSMRYHEPRDSLNAEPPMSSFYQPNYGYISSQQLNEGGWYFKSENNFDQTSNCDRFDERSSSNHWNYEQRSHYQEQPSINLNGSSAAPRGYRMIDQNDNCHRRYQWRRDSNWRNGN